MFNTDFRTYTALLFLRYFVMSFVRSVSICCLLVSSVSLFYLFSSIIPFLSYCIFFGSFIFGNKGVMNRRIPFFGFMFIYLMFYYNSCTVLIPNTLLWCIVFAYTFQTCPVDETTDSR
ncbi:hypothetical protein L228DRAFT_96273 [Xylona heveae TC161]|uniref:Uncharacterized protein n=1 Tax=Xylona heveae (strain CBS 132557 / TC161) TaxID=1328760 RepID=A0A161TEQ0_XYLHT|nr:hypothetical protein L228DRAFT_96273 [Xylona heveae TC161]KZF24427.1 hypothetical protein L228DRAFT_96273 [Xylona heveae TC161]